MLILSCSSKLQLLEGTLRRGLPETLLVASDDSDFCTNTYAVYYRDLGACRALLGSAVNWDQAFRIHGFRDGLCEASRDIAETKGAKLDVLGYFTYFHSDPSSLPEIRLDPAMRLSTLNISYVDLLNETWLFGGNERSRKYLDSLIRHFPSACLLDATGHPVSWTASDAFGALGPAYTLPQHRRCGYSMVLTNLMAKQLHALGYPSYGNVRVENFKPQKMMERQGFQRQPNLCYFILHNTALNTDPTLTPRPAGESPA